MHYIYHNLYAPETEARAQEETRGGEGQGGKGGGKAVGGDRMLNLGLGTRQRGFYSDRVSAAQVVSCRQVGAATTVV